VPNPVDFKRPAGDLCESRSHKNSVILSEVEGSVPSPLKAGRLN
jgi:hypothetical protein